MTFQIAPHGKTIIFVMDHNRENGQGHLRMTPAVAARELERLERLTARHSDPDDYAQPEDHVLGEVRNRMYVGMDGADLLFSYDTPPNVLDVPGKCHVYLSLSTAAKLIIPMRQGLGLAAPVRKRTRPNSTAPGATVRKRTRAT